MKNKSQQLLELSSSIPGSSTKSANPEIAGLRQQLKTLAMRKQTLSTEMKMAPAEEKEQLKTQMDQLKMQIDRIHSEIDATKSESIIESKRPPRIRLEDRVKINKPSSPHHGKTGTVLGWSPELRHHVKLDYGNREYFKTSELTKI